MSKFHTEDSHLILVNPKTTQEQGYTFAGVKMTPNDWVELILHAKARLKSLHDSDHNFGDSEIFTDKYSWR